MQCVIIVILYCYNFNPRYKKHALFKRFLSNCSEAYEVSDSCFAQQRKKCTTYWKRLSLKLVLIGANCWQILRKEASVLEILFLLMVSAGMPELMVEKDIHYLRDKLNLDMSSKKADKNLRVRKHIQTTYFRRHTHIPHAQLIFAYFNPALQQTHRTRSTNPWIHLTVVSIIWSIISSMGNRQAWVWALHNGTRNVCYLRCLRNHWQADV